MTPAEVCEKLGIQPSTLRKYSLLFEKEQIVYARNKNNSRNYTVMQVEALEQAVELSKDIDITLEEAVRIASKHLKTESVITPESDITPIAPQRHNGDMTAVMVEEIQFLREEIRKRDEEAAKREEARKERELMYVEALEKMQHTMDEVLARLPEPKNNDIDNEDGIQEDTISKHPIEKDITPNDTTPKKKGFFSRLFK